MRPTHDDPVLLVQLLEPLYRQLSAQLHEPNVHLGDSEGAHQKPGPRFVGNTAAFNLLTDIDAGVRGHDAALRRANSIRARLYGGAAAVTIAVLRALPYRIDQAPDALYARIVRDLTRWHATSEIVLGLRERWAPLERHACPACGGTNVRHRTEVDEQVGGTRYVVRCFPPQDVDRATADELHPCTDPSTGDRWRVELSSLELLSWAG